MRTYDEATQPSQSRHACRAQGLRLQPFLPIPMGDRHFGEARLRFRLHRWRAWAVWLDQLEDLCRTAERHNLTTIARVPDIGSSTILRYLDRGIMGILGP